MRNGRARRTAAGAALLALATAVSTVAMASNGSGDAAAQAPAPAGATGRPNVVVVMTDDQDVGSMRVMDAVDARLASEGTTFRNFFATTPICCPSRATFLTGQYAHNHGIGGKDPYEAAVDLNFDESGTLPVALDQAGYRTGLIGKYLSGYGGDDERPSDIPLGWDSWHGAWGPPTRQYDYTLNENGELNHYGTGPRDYQTDVYARKAVNFIGRSAREPDPFFLTVAPSAPHGEKGVRKLDRNPRPAPRHEREFEHEPLPTPPSFDEEDVSDKPFFVQQQPTIDEARRRKLVEEHQDRLASLLAVDDAVARIVAKLRRTGELDDTLIFFTSDNGFLAGQHRLHGKKVLYEESVRVPLIVRGPGFPAGAVRRQVTGNIDLAPTIIDAARARPLRVMDGTSLLPLAADPGVRRKRDILLENTASGAVRTPRYMYAEHPRDELELYDLARDPLQLESLHLDSAYDGVRERLDRRLAELRSCAGATCR